MADNTLLISDQGAIRSITINRPDKLNALNAQVLRELGEAFEQARSDPSVRVILLRGAGDKAFVAGADIREFSSLAAADARDFSRLGQDVMQRMETLGKPIIAVIQGFALGGGLELAMCCHLRIASDRARVGQPEINLGVLPGFGGTQRLLRLAGRSAALELCLLGAPIDAARAHALGILTRVVPADALETEAEAVAQQLAASAPLALRAILDAILRGGECAIDQGLDYESQLFGLIAASEDMREGTRAFLEKRKPAFQGR